MLRELGSSAAYVVHGHGGLDELTTTGVTQVHELRDDEAVRGLLVTGSGDKAFVAGADINELAALASDTLKNQYGQYIMELIREENDFGNKLQ